MPNILSAKKRVKLSNKYRLENKIFKTKLKNVIKDFYSSNHDEITKNFNLAMKIIDNAVCKNIIHKNNAAHKKQKLHLKLNSIMIKK